MLYKCYLVRDVFEDNHNQKNNFKSNSYGKK